ncbi:MAG: hypothetical protein K2Z81_26175 [Cyanobacteria bacterium]|nr:hypothetical protein [Cyanobacteriota bacterium]
MSQKRDDSSIIARDAEEMSTLLLAGMVDEFMRLFKASVKEGEEESILNLAELVNQKIHEQNPTCDVKLVVSQKNKNEKRLIMIMDGSKFFGDSFTVTKQIFTI